MIPEPEVDLSADILIVDDELPIAELLGEILRMRGHRTTLCESATEALRMLDGHEFDVILSDLRMPEMSGQEFHGQVAARDPGLASRIVFITGDAVSGGIQRFLQETGNRHLSKPFRLSLVEQIIAQVLQDRMPGRCPG